MAFQKLVTVLAAGGRHLDGDDAGAAAVLDRREMLEERCRRPLRGEEAGGPTFHPETVVERGERGGVLVTDMPDEQLSLGEREPSWQRRARRWSGSVVQGHDTIVRPLRACEIGP